MLQNKKEREFLHIKFPTKTIYNETFPTTTFKKCFTIQLLLLTKEHEFKITNDTNKTINSQVEIFAAI